MRRFLALFVLVVGSIAAYLLLSGPTEEVQPAIVQTVEEPPPEVEVLIAVQSIAEGDFLREEVVATKIIEMTQEDARENGYFPTAVFKAANIVGSIALRDIILGDILSQNNVTMPSGSGFLAQVLRPGMRAFVARWPEDSGVTANLFAGDHIDLIWVGHEIIKGRAPGNEHRSHNDRRVGGSGQTNDFFYGRILLEDIRVVAVGMDISGADSGDYGVARSAPNVTLELTPQQAVLLAMAFDRSHSSKSALFPILRPPRKMASNDNHKGTAADDGRGNKKVDAALKNSGDGEKVSLPLTLDDMLKPDPSVDRTGFRILRGQAGGGS